MTDEEKKKESHDLHQKSKALLYQKNTTLCGVMLGTLSLVIGVIFIPLSFQRVRNRFTGIDFTSLSFILCCVCLGVGAILLLGGTMMALRAEKKRRDVQRKLMRVQ